MGLEIDNDLKNGLKSCYLLYGEDSVRRKIYEDRIKKKLVDEASELMNVSVFNDAKTTAGQIIEAAETFPFLSDRRVVIVRECGFFTENKKNGKRYTCRIYGVCAGLCMYSFFGNKDRQEI